MSKGRQQLTKGQRFEAMEKTLKQLQMSVQVNQMLMKQIGNTISPMQSDLQEFIGRQRELQYRVLAVQELADLDIETINAKSRELQIRDFEETSEKEDAEKGYTAADVVAEDSVITLTSTTPEEEEDKGILRSKMEYSEFNLPELKEALLGAKVGDLVDADVNGVKHKIEVLKIGTVPPAPEEPAENVTPIPTGTQDVKEAQQENG
jgi:hypothetical protein